MVDKITKALTELAKAIESNTAVESVKVTITIKKQKTDKG